MMLKKLITKNNWESVTYYDEDGNQIDPEKITKVKIQGTWYSTIIKNVRVSYSDMGRTYEGGGLRLFAIDRLADIDLDKLRGKDIFIEEDSVISQLNTEE